MGALSVIAWASEKAPNCHFLIPLLPSVPVGPSSPNKFSCFLGKGQFPRGINGSVKLGHFFKEYSQTENAQIKHLLSIATSYSTHIPPLVQAGSDRIKSLQTGIICDLKSQIMQIKKVLKATAARGTDFQLCRKSQLGVSPKEESNTDFPQEPLQLSKKHKECGGKFLLFVFICQDHIAYSYSHYY